MASATLITSGGTVTPGGSTDTTASGSWGANRLQLVGVVSRMNSSVVPNQPTLSGGPGSWSVVATSPYDSTDPSRKRLTLFKSKPSSSGSGALTVNFVGQTQTTQSWMWIEIVGGYDVVQSAINSVDGANVLTATLAAFASSSNVTVGFFGADNNTNTFVAGPNSGAFTTVGDDFSATLNISSEFANSAQTSVDGRYTPSGVAIGAIAVEITTTLVSSSSSDALMLLV